MSLPQINDKVTIERKAGPAPGDIEVVDAVVVDTFYRDDPRSHNPPSWHYWGEPRRRVRVRVLVDGTFENCDPEWLQS